MHWNKLKTVRTDMHLLVTRPAHQAQKTGLALADMGHSSTHQPMLTVERLDTPLPVVIDSIRAVILTSTNAVQAITELWSTPSRSEIPVLTTGQETRRSAIDAGFTNAQSANGSALDLATQFPDWAKQQGLSPTDTVLYPCAEETAHDLQSLLKKFADCIAWPVYRTVQIDTLSDDVASQLKNGQIDGVLLYSARTAQSFVSSLKRASIDGSAVRTYVLSKDIFNTLPEDMRSKSKYPERPEERLLLDLLDP